MGKSVRKFGLGLLLGAAAGHYFTTEKGQQTWHKLKEEVAIFKTNPSTYKEEMVKRIKETLAEHIQTAYDNKDDIMALFSTEEGEEVSEQVTQAEVDDIVLTYDEEV